MKILDRFTDRMLLFSEDSDIRIEEIRKRLLHRVLVLIVVFGVPTLALAIFEGLQMNQYYSPLIYVGGIILILLTFFLREKLSPNILISIIIFLSFGISILNLFSYGFTGAALQVFLVVSLLVGLVAGLKKGLATLVVAGLIMLFTGYLVTSRIIELSVDIEAISYLPISWITAATVLVLLGAVVILGFGIVEKNLQNSLQIVRSQATELKKINGKLSKEIKRVNSIRKDLRKSKEQAEESDKLKSAFMRNISHEFRTPMNSIVGFTELMLRDDIPEGAKTMYAETIKKNCMHLLDIVDDTVEIAKIQTSTLKTVRERFNVNDIIADVVRRRQNDISAKNLKFFGINNLPEEGFYLMSDSFKVRRSLEHILDNACKFTLEGEIKLKSEHFNDCLKICIEDTGIGIPENKTENIFRPFNTVETELDRRFEGQGVGLSLVKAYMESLGGSVSLKSEVDVGTSVEITIPVS